MCKIVLLLKSEDGATAVEYALIAGLIFLAIVSSVSVLGETIAGKLYRAIADGFSSIGF